jgi:hypothetical protein
VPRHDRALGLGVVGAAGEHDVPRGWQRARRGTDAADQEPRLVECREDRQPQPAGGEERAPSRGRQQIRGGLQRSDLMPVITRAGRPRRPEQPEQRCPRSRARRRGVPADGLGEWVGRIDHGRDVLGGQPAAQPVHATEAPDPHLASRPGRISYPAGQRGDHPQARLPGQPGGQLPRLGRPGEDQDGGSGHGQSGRLSR